MSGYQKTHKSQPQQKNDRAKKPEHPPKASFKAGQMLEAPETLRPEDVLLAQQQVGNQVVQRSLDGTIQRDGEEFDSLGGGSKNKVYHVTRPGGGFLHKKPAGPSGYYKPNTADDPQMGARAVMSSDIDQTLGLNVLSKETYKTYNQQRVHSGKGKDKVKDLREGTESSEVKGETLYDNLFEAEIDKGTYDVFRENEISAKKRKIKDAKEKDTGERKYFKLSGTSFRRHDYTNPQTQKDLANIHLQDAITGQHDRHGGNIKIDRDTGQARGYDNDLMQPLQEIGDNSLSHLPGLHKPATGPMSAEQRTARNAARAAALKKIDTPSDKYLGLPSHIDQASAQTLAGLKSRDFIGALNARDHDNMARLNPEQIEELRNRYSSVRRYAKAGLAAQKPELITDPLKRAKWSTPEYQATVRQGAGMLPNIVGNWGRETYNQQMSMTDPDATRGLNKQNFSYMQKGVKNYNETLAGLGDGGAVTQNADAGPLPTHILPPKPHYPPPQPPAPPPTHVIPDRRNRYAGKFNPVVAPPLQAAPPVANQMPPLLASSQTRSHGSQSGHVKDLISKFDAGEVHLQADRNRYTHDAADANGFLVPDLNDAIQKKRGSGASLPESARKVAKKALGRDFKDVRIHTDDESHRLSRAISARAFTIGKDIFFKRGVFAPGTSSGRETILHELTHVVQQSGSKASGPLKLGAPDTVHEKEANQIGKKHAATVPVGAAQGSAVQAQNEEELQAQPDAGGVVQRVGFDPEELRAKATQMQQRVAHRKAMTGIKDKAESMKLGSSEHMSRLNNLEKKPEFEKQKKRAFMAGLATKQGKKNRESREAENERLKAKQDEKEAGTFKGGFKKAWKEEIASPVKSFMKGLPGKIGGGIVKGGKALGMGALKGIGSGFTEGFKHFFGSGKSEDKDKDDEKDEKKGNKKGEEKDEKEEKDSGAEKMKEKYAEVLKENKELKAELAKLQKEED